MLGQCFGTTPGRVMLATVVVTVAPSSTSDTTHGSVALAGTVKSQTQPEPRSIGEAVGSKADALTEASMCGEGLGRGGGVSSHGIPAHQPQRPIGQIVVVGRVVRENGVWRTALRREILRAAPRITRLDLVRDQRAVVALQQRRDLSQRLRHRRGALAEEVRLLQRVCGPTPVIDASKRLAQPVSGWALRPSG